MCSDAEMNMLSNPCFHTGITDGSEGPHLPVIWMSSFGVPQLVRASGFDGAERQKRRAKSRMAAEKWIVGTHKSCRS